LIPVVAFFATIHFNDSHIRIVGQNYLQSHTKSRTTPNAKSLHQLYNSLPKELRRLCGSVRLPTDGGTSLIKYLQENDQNLVGCGDSSLKEAQCSHAWVLSTGEIRHMNDPDMSITGLGPVDGHEIDLSSSRGELQSQTAMAIMTNTLLQSHDAMNTPVTLLGDNKGVQNRCQNPQANKMSHHRKPNTDLLIEYEAATRNLTIKSEWVKGHQDKDMDWESFDDLKELKLSNPATMNIWCDKLADNARQTYFSHPDADVYPNEKWAVFTTSPNTRKITGNLDYNILQSMQGQNMETYIHKNHGICPSKLKDLNTEGLHCYMKKCKPHWRANVAKLIHQWIPTNDFLNQQDRTTSPLCPRCLHQRESMDHILTCPHTEAQASRSLHIYKMLRELETSTTSVTLLSSLECHLTNSLDIPNKGIYKISEQPAPTQALLSKTTRHQNLIGWNEFMRGYISKYWTKLHHTTKQESKIKRQCPWNIKITRLVLDAHRGIWEDRNKHVYGKTIEESRERARQAIIKRVRQLYDNPPPAGITV
jgi:hypothetical protein